MDVRCLDAEDMLRRGYTTKAVAQELRFADAAHLCREVKKRYGVVPQQVFMLGMPSPHATTIMDVLESFAAVQQLRPGSIMPCRPATASVFSSVYHKAKGTYEQSPVSEERLRLCNFGDAHSDTLRADRGSVRHHQSLS
jgi:AraC-like DNA-binding protein